MAPAILGHRRAGRESRRMQPIEARSKAMTASELTGEMRAARERYYTKVGGKNLSALWTTTLVPPLPQNHIRARPHLWDFDNLLRPLLLESGGLITAREANRRVLTLENPGLAGEHRILES